ncbi:YmfQ family protein [Yersinia enterocolitica]|nr:YmfQ family protein [Yersinia enterocolitica]MCV3310786.1 YmfQ family protein [Yersinia enterocolitica]UYJ87951.1 YmfQ family protein [Yersinia enterocolitica]UYJ91940.1 YmfQ family protein [Yersinia enterocolitica]UYK08999.1 YmfQ family protein [Yersinia enterocolitica]UYK21459.1 YmfQ family protein [Yersinia enterocolitica]
MSRYSVNDYTAALQALMPAGLVWPKISGGVQTSTLRALARSYQHSDEDARDLLDAAFSSTARRCFLNGRRRLGYRIYVR